MPPSIVYHTSIAEFVDPKVKTIAVTDQIIAAIMPYFPKSAKVISGWLSDDDLYWKVNFHWDYLLETIEHCEGLEIAENHKTSLAAIKKALWTNAPSPARGYRTSNVGEPKDSSSREVILKRHAVVKQAKIDFTLVEAKDPAPLTGHREAPVKKKPRDIDKKMKKIEKYK